MKGFKRGIWLVVLWTVIFAVTGCQSSNGSSSGVAMSDLVDKAEFEREEAIEIVRQTKEEDLKRHYANGIYFEDFSAEIKLLNEMFEKELMKQYSETVPSNQCFIDSRTIFYNDSLSKLKNNELTVDEILTNLEKHVRELKYEVYIDQKDVIKQMHFSEEGVDEVAESERDRFVELGINRIEIAVYALREGTYKKAYAIKEKKPKVLYDELYLAHFIEEKEVFEQAKNCFDPWIEDGQVAEPFLKKKYGQDFMFVKAGDFIDGYYKVVGSDELYFRSECNPYMMDNVMKEIGLDFQIEDTYLQVLAQKTMTDEINKIIEEVQMQDTIAAVVLPDLQNDDYQYVRAYDAANADVYSILNEGYKGDYDITLSYIKDATQKVDLQVLKNIVGRISKLLDGYTDHDGTIYTRYNVFVYIYDMNEADQGTAIALLNENKVNDIEFEGVTKLGDIYSSMYRDRIENDAFHFLDVFGKKEDYMYWFLQDPTDWTMEEIESRKKKNLYE